MPGLITRGGLLAIVENFEVSRRLLGS